jgi:pimeloyl-ACP methyl ester carboxylesterase
MTARNESPHAHLPIVLLPGQLCTAALWRHQCEALSPDFDTRVMVLDRQDNVRDMASWVLEQMPAEFSLAAHAMGGFVAFEILRQAPARVVKLALLSTLAPADTSKQTERRQGYLRLVEQGRFAQIIEERIPMLVHPNRVSDENLVGVVRQMAAETGPEAFQRQQRAIMSRQDSTESLASIPCETLIVFGRADAITTLDHQQQMLDRIPNARLEIVEGSGHMVTLERPDVVNTAFRAFFL